MFGDVLKASGGYVDLSEDLTQGLVAHYLLNNNADDSFGTYDGTPSGGVDFQGDVANFDGIDDYVDINSIGYLTQTFSISLWVKADLYRPAEADYIFNSRETSGTRISITNGLTGIALNYNGGGIVFTSEVVSTLYHVVAVGDGTNIEMFVDGISVDSGVFSGTDGVDRSVVLGREGVAGLHFGGIISNVRIYNEAKDQDFINALYSEGYYPKPLPLPTTENLLAHYPLTGTAEDAQGAGGNESGTEYNGVAFTEEGSRGLTQLAKFDGLDSKITLGNVAVDDDLQLNNDGTICFWMRTNFLGDEYKRIIDKSDGANGQNGYFIYINNALKRVYAVTGDSVGSSTLVSYADISTHEDKLVHIGVVIRNNNTIRIFVNGIAIAVNETINGAVSNVLTPITIGSWNHSTGREYNGELQDLQIYNEELTDAEIVYIYKNSGTLKSSLIHRYKLDGNPLDSKGNRDGTEVGNVTYYNHRGSVASFDGVDDYITTPYKDIKYVISAWVYNDGVNEGVVADSSAISTYYRGFLSYFRHSIGKLVVQCFSPNNDSRLDYDISGLSVGWHHVYIEVENGHQKIVLDGDITNALTGTGAIDWTATPNLQFGKLGYNNSYKEALESDVRVYDRYLTDLEVEALFNEVDEPTDGLVAHYPLTKEWRANDAWVAYDGTEVGNTYVDDAEFGSAADFTLSSVDRVDIANLHNNFSANAPFTLCAWVNLDSLGQGEIIELARYNVDGFRLLTLNGKVYGQMFAGASGYITSSPTALSVGEWGHFAATYDGETIRVYLNGILENSISGASYTAPVFTKLGTENAHTNTLDGRIRNARVYKDALSAKELVDIYNYENNFRHIDIDDGLIAYYPLENNSLDNYRNEYDGADTAMTYDGKSALFNGTTSHVNTTLETLPESGSISAWLDVTAGETYGDVFCATNGLVRVEGTTIVLWMAKNNDWNTAVYTSHLCSTSLIGRLVHVAWSWTNLDDYTTFKAYEDGVEIPRTANGTFNHSGTYAGGTIGLRNYSNNLYDIYLKGSLGKVRVYNKQLQPEQVEAIYNSEKGTFQ